MATPRRSVYILYSICQIKENLPTKSAHNLIIFEICIYNQPEQEINLLHRHNVFCKTCTNSPRKATYSFVKSSHWFATEHRCINSART